MQNAQKTAKTAMQIVEIERNGKNVLTNAIRGK